jgi:hypothetical protein
VASSPDAEVVAEPKASELLEELEPFDLLLVLPDSLEELELFDLLVVLLEPLEDPEVFEESLVLLESVEESECFFLFFFFTESEELLELLEVLAAELLSDPLEESDFLSALTLLKSTLGSFLLSALDCV